MGELANILPQVWTAITTQVGLYFKETDRLSREFLFPALAFVLGLLLIVMGAVGVDAPRIWWNDLPNDGRLLILALLVVLLAMVSELSRLLVRTVRQLYGGEWPTWTWWQQWLRQPHAQQYLRNAKNRKVLDDAQVILNRALLELDIPAPVTDYPTLRYSLDAYQIVAADNFQRTKAASVPSAITSPSDLLGRYTVEPVGAGTPIQAGKLKPLPDIRYLGPDRRLLVLDLPKPGPQLQAGAVVTLYLFTTQRGMDMRRFDDLFVLSRSGPEQVVLSAPAGEVDEILPLLPRRKVAFSYSPFTQQAVLVARPFSTRELRPGQLLGKGENFEWRIEPVAEPLQRLDQVADPQDQIYWPATSALQNGELGPHLPANTRVVPGHLRSIPLQYWSYVDGQATRQRRVYALDLTDPKVHRPQAIATADLLDISLDGQLRETECYVIHVGADLCYMAVRDPARLAAQVAQAASVTLTRLAPGEAILRRINADLPRLSSLVAWLESDTALAPMLAAASIDSARLDRYMKRIERLARRLVKLGQEVNQLPGNQQRQPVFGSYIDLLNRLIEAIRHARDAVVNRTLELEPVVYVMPDKLEDVRPTRLGNIMAAAADYPIRAYQIDARSILPKLLDVLDADDATAKRLTSVESSLNMLLLYSFWAGVLTALGFAILLTLNGSWWVYLLVMTIGPLLWWLTREAAVAQALTYGEALKAVFDLHRRQLLVALGVSIPADGITPLEEQKDWRAISRWFSYGLVDDRTPALKPMASPQDKSGAKKPQE